MSSADASRPPGLSQDFGGVTFFWDFSDPGLIQSETRLVLTGIQHDTVFAHAKDYAAQTPENISTPNLAAVPNLTGVLLELGGKSPNIVFADADQEAAANGVIAGVFAASGQTCMAGPRLPVQREAMDDLVSRVAARARSIRVGDPADPETEMGPMATPGQHAKVEGMLRQALADGARFACGGLDDPGSPGGLFVPPTMVLDVRPDMEIAREEVFGPVLCVMPFDTEEGALRLANDTRFGLAAGVWTNDVRRAHRMGVGALRRSE